MDFHPPQKVVLDVVDVNFNVFFAGILLGWSFFWGNLKGGSLTVGFAIRCLANNMRLTLT